MENETKRDEKILAYGTDRDAAKGNAIRERQRHQIKAGRSTLIKPAPGLTDKTEQAEQKARILNRWWVIVCDRDRLAVRQ